MKKYLFLMLLLSSVSGISQTLRDFSGAINIYSSIGSGPSYTVEGFFNDILSYYASDSVAVGDVIYVSNGPGCARLEITAVNSDEGGIINATVLDVDTVMLSPPSGVSGIARETANNNYPIDMPGVPQTLISCILTHFIELADNATGGGEAIDGNRPILRALTAGVTPGGATPAELLEYMFFAPPTITCNLSPTTTVYEVGTSNSITISGATSNPGSATLSGGVLTRTVPSSNVVNSFGTGTSYSTGITFYPQKDSTGDYKQLTYSFQASQAWVFGAESGTASSTTRTVTGVYPVLYGMDAADLSGATGSTIYTTLSKLVEAEGNKTVTLSGVSEYIYYAVPKTWGDFTLSSILDPNSFNILGGFTSYDVTITSSGLANNWTQDYKLYKLNLTTSVAASPAQNYQFIR